MKVGIIILSWNSKKMIDDCLSGLLKHASCPVYVVDNGSIDGSPDFISQSYPSVTLLRSPVNLGFASGNNFGIQQALKDGCDAVFLLNNDTIIDENFLVPCVEIMESNPRVGIVGPIVVEGYNPEVVQCRGGDITLWSLGFPYRGAGEQYQRSGRTETVGYILGAAMLIRREVIEKTGGLDPEYFPAYVEEADLCFTARKLGYEVIITHAARVRHIGDRSSGGDENSYRRYTVNRLLFGIKHLNPLVLLIASHILVWRFFLRRVVKRVF